MIVRFADGARPDLDALVPGLAGLAPSTTTTTSTSTSTTIPSTDPSTEPTTTAPAATPAPSDANRLQLVRRLDSGAWVVKLPSLVTDTQARQLAAGWSDGAAVVSAEPDYRSFAQATPNDPRFTDQWDLQPPTSGNMGSDLVGAWDVNTGSSAATVAVIDTGFRPHADLVGQLLPGYDFIASSDNANDGNGQDADASDPGDWVTQAEATDTTGPFYKCGAGDDRLSAKNSSWHGTHVSGTIGATTNNSTGIAGINWAARIVPVRVLGKCGGYDSDIADGMYWAAGLPVAGVPNNPHPARVLNLSLGGQDLCSPVFQNAIDAVRAVGAVVVVAAGNSAINVADVTPANCNGVIAVGATDRNGNLARYSDFGSGVDVSAPGGAMSSRGDLNGILSTYNEGGDLAGTMGYAPLQGTSMAAPHVSGVVALMLSVNPGMGADQVEAILKSTLTPLPAGSMCNRCGDTKPIPCTAELCGHGIVNASAAGFMKSMRPSVQDNAGDCSPLPLLRSSEKEWRRRSFFRPLPLLPTAPPRSSVLSLVW